MEPPAGTRGRGTRLVLVAMGLFALLAIVGFASRSGFGGSSDARPSPTYVSYAFSIFLVLFVLAIPVTMYAFFLQGRENAFQHRRSFKRVVLQNVLTLAFCIGIVVAVIELRRSGHLPRFQNTPAAQVGDAVKNARGKNPPYEPVFQWPVLAVAIPLLVGLATWLIVSHRRRKRRLQGKVPIERAAVALDVAASIGDAIDDLEAEPDARRAVIAAYARMEGALARHGIPRKPSETPFEYLRRVLLDLRAPAEAVQRLTGAFERAKFSRHEIDAGVKRSAIDALVEVRDGLQAAAA